MLFSRPEQNIRSSFCLYAVLLLPWSQSSCSSREKSHLSKAAKLNFSSDKASFEKLERAVTGAGQPRLSLMLVSTVGMQHIFWAKPEANRLNLAVCNMQFATILAEQQESLCPLSAFSTACVPTD